MYEDQLRLEVVFNDKALFEIMHPNLHKAVYVSLVLNDLLYLTLNNIKRFI